MDRIAQLLCRLIGGALLAATLRGETRVSLIGPTAPVQPGETVTIERVVVNIGSAPMEVAAPPVVAGRLVRDDSSRSVTLRLIDPGAGSVAAGGFVRQVYTLQLPENVAGWWVLDLVEGGAPVRTGFDVQRAVPGLVQGSSSSGPPRPVPPEGASPHRLTSLADPEPAASAIVRTFAGRIAPHEPIYFIYGSDEPGAKFQFSFKYRVFTFHEPPTGRWPDSLQFAFTQRSLWDLRGESSPFYDTSYIPEVILESMAPERAPIGGWLSVLGYQLGYRHESNGREGEVSRSLNQLFFRPVLAFGPLEGWHLLLAPEVYAYLGELENNPDLKDYRGYGSLRLMFGRSDGPALAVAAWAGRDFDHATYQIDLTVPIRTRLLDFQTYLLLQYFDGYGESLLSYRERSDAWRAGISLVR